MFNKTLIAAMLAVALLSSAEAQSRRDIRGPAIPPPVVSQTISAQRGEKVTVHLGIHGARGEQLEFFIRTPPSHGKLSPVKSMGINSATVTYTPSARSTAPEDRFSYSVRGSEGVSAPGVFAIRFVDPVIMAAKLKAPGELEFPPVYPGQRSTVDMELANEGGGILEGEVAVQEPWSIEGLKFFRIAAGRSTTIKLVFTPAQPGVRTGEAIISGTVRKIIPLRASADERLATAPALLKLTAQPGNQTRMGVLKITNLSAEDAHVIVEAGARLMTDRTVKVPAHGTSSVPVFADAATNGAFDDTVKLSSKEWTASVPVHAVAVGAILKFTVDEMTIKGSAGAAVAGGIAILENSGGEALTVRLDIARPFEVEGLVVTAPARGRVEIPVFVRGSGAGTFRSTLKAIGEDGSAIAQLKAEIAEVGETQFASRTRIPASGSRPDALPEENEPNENEMLQIPQNVREIPNALGKLARGTGENSAVIDWPMNLGPLEYARIEERALSLSDNDELQIGWSPLTEATITPAGERVHAELRGLKPGTLYAVRVITGKGPDTAVLFTTDFRTAAKKPFDIASIRTPLLVLALMLLAYAIWRERRRPRKAKKVSRRP